VIETHIDGLGLVKLIQPTLLFIEMLCIHIPLLLLSRILLETLYSFLLFFEKCCCYSFTQCILAYIQFLPIMGLVAQNVEHLAAFCLCFFFIQFCAYAFVLDKVVSVLANVLDLN
jgi:hypothetical protein